MTFLLLMLALLGAAPNREIAAGKRWLTPEQAEKLAVKLAERRPFVDSEEARSAEGRQTMGLFFSDKEYRLMRGNPVFGYWHAAGFRWTGNRIAWDGVVSKAKSCRRITKKAWDVAFTYAASKHGLVVDRTAPLRMRGACVYANIDASVKEPVRGVIMEMRLDSPSGAFRWRYSRGNPTIEGAVGASIELPLLLAPKVNQKGWPKDGP